MNGAGAWVHPLALGLAASAAIALATWLASLRLRDVSIVDSVWSLMVVAPGLVAWAVLPDAGPRTVVVLLLAGLWALRLAGYITWRHWGHDEDRRYREIRARNQPHFERKSVYLVFGLQALLATIVSLPLVAAVASPAPWRWLDAVGLVMGAAGLAIETLADAQLARFKADPANRGHVLRVGLWRYSRHPNYFGDFCLWWGFGLVAVSAGAWWALASPLLMSVLLMRVSGVTLLEKDIGMRRPAYRNYVARTNAFFPWKPRA
jgi:steroid 5-alpha reductase family enzyme